MASEVRNNICTICLDPIQGSKQPQRISLLSCDHYPQFHEQCIKTWLKIPEHKCPLCRGDQRAAPLQERVLPVRAARPELRDRRGGRPDPALQRRLMYDAWRELYNPDVAPTATQLRDLSDILRDPRSTPQHRALAMNTIRVWRDKGFAIPYDLIEQIGGNRDAADPSLDPDLTWLCCFCCLVLFCR
ncbi:MAG: E3 ubiquitin protein ligase [Parachlamydiales bacterium]|nr:E3 ubiquitin protein ligase [Parachlamydiales bacterium]